MDAGAMETCLTCQCHKAGVTSCTLLSRPHGSFPPVEGQRKLAALLPREIQGCPPSVPPSRAPEGLGYSSVGLGSPVLFFLTPRHNISVWWPLVKTPLPAPDRSVHVSGTGQHVTDREVRVGPLEVLKVISYELVHRDPKTFQEPGWDPGNTAVGTPA